MPPKDAKESGKIIGEKSENHMALRSGLSLRMALSLPKSKHIRFII
ncbi:hypothetical protein COLO4_20018 [Corchorus olitorius]|uniref:Uncharacterized protein n=1 Tax=Corchorus olitorius TaxID=93759 RepID=A0A1R3J2E2_9ROSI|nr:hypothetical protein COLO4_20018 [Corchorus olitorius]